MVSTHAPTSNHIEQFSYDPDTRKLTVTFRNGRAYTYLNVPPEVFDRMKAYRSAGEFYHGVVKRYYKLGGMI